MRKKLLDPSSGPAAAWGVQLRRSREAAGYTQVGAGRELGYSDSYLSSLERAERNPTIELARSADLLFGTGGTLELMFWQISGTAMIEGFAEYEAHEQKAVLIRAYEIGIPFGLVQSLPSTEAWEQGEVDRGSATPAQAAERVARMQVRQTNTLGRTPPPTLHVVLDESCLHNQIGGPVVLAAQLAHLEELSTRPHVILQVAPYAMGAGRPFLRTITLLTMPDGSTLGYTETQQRGYLERDKDTVTTWARGYDRLQVDAPSCSESRALIRQARKDLTRQ